MESVPLHTPQNLRPNTSARPHCQITSNNNIIFGLINVNAPHVMMHNVHTHVLLYLYTYIYTTRGIRGNRAARRPPLEIAHPVCNPACD